jgi:hypothetical protein
MKLYFRHSDRRTTLLSEPETIDEAFVAINKFLKDHNFKSYYKRVCGTDDDSIWIDVGSHSEFFIIKGITFEDYMKMNNERNKED